MGQTELLAIGGAYVDINCSNFPFTDQGLAVETETVGQAYEVEPGGSAVNFARLCRSLEIPTMFIGKVGDDVMGETLTELLTMSGVQPELVVDNSCRTNISFNVTNSHNQTIMSVVGNANQSLTAEEVYERAATKLQDCSHLYIGGCFKLHLLLPAFARLVDLAKDTNTKVALDHGRVHSNVTEEQKAMVRELAKTADYYFPSAQEFVELWGFASPEEGLTKLQPQVTGRIVVKDGEQGAMAIDQGKVLRVPAFSVQPIHTVGAGDSFNAGFMAAQIEGQDLLPSLRFGSATAALKISRQTLPTYNDVSNFLEL